MESDSGEDIKIIAQTAAIWSGINSPGDRATSTLHSRAFFKRSNLTGRMVRCHNHWSGAMLLALAGAGSGPPTSRSTILVPRNTGLSAFRWPGSGGRELLLTLPAGKGLRTLSSFRCPLVSADARPPGSTVCRKPAQISRHLRPAPGASRESC